MTPREQELALRRAALLERSARLRTDIAHTTEAIGSRLSGVGRIVSAVQVVTRAPVLLAGSALLVLMAGPAKALQLASRALVVLGLLRRIISLRDASRP
jgi:hypothetical protein